MISGKQKHININKVQKNPRAHKNKIGTPPPPPKKKTKKGEFYGHGFSCRKNAFFQVSIKLAHPFPAPELRQEKNKLNFLWPKMARLGPRFGPPKSPEKVYVYVPLLRSFPANEAHKLFSGGPKSGVLGGGQKVYVEKVYVLFPSLNATRCVRSPMISGKEKTHKHKQSCGIVPGLGGCQKVVYVCVFFFSFLVGEKKHINKIPPKIPGQSREIFVYVFVLYVFFFAPYYPSFPCFLRVSERMRERESDRVKESLPWNPTFRRGGGVQKPMGG